MRLQQQCDDARHDAGRHRRAAQAKVRRAIGSGDDTIGQEFVERAARHVQRHNAATGRYHVGLGPARIAFYANPDITTAGKRCDLVGSVR